MKKDLKKMLETILGNQKLIMKALQINDDLKTKKEVKAPAKKSVVAKKAPSKSK